MSKQIEVIADQVLRWARAAGADDAEVSVHESTEFSAGVRMGTVETLTEAASRGLQLRVFVSQRMARAGTSDLRLETLEGLTQRAVERARLANADPFAGLPEETGVVPEVETLKLYDPALEEWSAAEKISLAQETEKIGLSLDPRVNNSGGANFHVGRSRVWLVNTRGFAAGYRSTGCSLSLHLLGQDSDQQAQVSDYWFTAARQRSELETPEEVARRTVERVRRHLGARKIETQEVPVVFEPVLAAELLSDLFGAVTGNAIYLRRSFLVDQLGKKIAAEGVTVIDDGLLPGRLGTRPFDREGVAS